MHKKPQLMAILNCTPDSFHAEHRTETRAQAVQKALQMVADGADILDIGGESTRPGAAPVPAHEQIERVQPVIQDIRRVSDIPISIDTSAPEVMAAALEAGANMINDVRALSQPGTLDLAIHHGVPVCLMHMQGDPKTMQQAPTYANNDVVSALLAWFETTCTHHVQAGLDPAQIMIDPGFGFGKTLAQNWQLLNQLEQFQTLGYPVMVGASRKSMFQIMPHAQDIAARMIPSITAATLAITKGASIIRTHDIKQTLQAIDTCWWMHQEGQT